MLDIVTAGVDGEILAQGRQTEMTAAVVRMTLRGSAALRAIEHDKGCIGLPTAAESHDSALGINVLCRRARARWMDRATQIVEGEQRVIIDRNLIVRA